MKNPHKNAKRSSRTSGIIAFIVGLLVLAIALGWIVYCGQYDLAMGWYALAGVGILSAAWLIYTGLTHLLAESASQAQGIADGLRRMEQQRRLMRGPRVVAIGGGTGLPSLLRGLKAYTSNITAIVTVADNGGGTGRLRHDMGIVAPGDIRNCIVALADAEPTLQALFSYRFGEGELRGQSFGNLYLAAMSEVTGGFLEAVRYTSDVLAVKGEVLPVTLESVNLCAELDDASRVFGEAQIPQIAARRGQRIRRLLLDRACHATDEALDAIRQADLIVFGPGSLYTSVIANLLVGDIAREVRRARAAKILVCNIMTQPGETSGYKLSDHVQAILSHGGRGVIHSVVCNKRQDIPDEILSRYAQMGAQMVENDVKDCEALGVRVFAYDLVDLQDAHVRHSAEALGHAVMEVYRQTRFMDSVILRKAKQE